MSYTPTYNYPHASLDRSRGFRIYRNLHKRTFSIQSYVVGKGWRVVAHGDNFLAFGVTFEVNELGRQKVLQERKKNVHAFAYAQSIHHNVKACFKPRGEYPIGYNPYAAPPLGSEGRGSFYIDGPHLAIGKAEAVWFQENGNLVGLQALAPNPSSIDHG